MSTRKAKETAETLEGYRMVTVKRPPITVKADLEVFVVGDAEGISDDVYTDRDEAQSVADDNGYAVLRYVLATKQG